MQALAEGDEVREVVEEGFEDWEVDEVDGWEFEELEVAGEEGWVGF